MTGLSPPGPSVPTLSLPGRIQADELMDIEEVTDADLARCLRDLERVNRASLGYRPTLRWLDRAARGRTHLTILDVGFGGGDMLRQVARWARRRRKTVTLIGLDINPAAARVAAAATDTGLGIAFETADLFDWPADRPVDIILNALFAHHLADADLPRFLHWMEERARVGWFVNDLHRHWIPEWGLRILFAILPVHRFVRHDGPVSVRRAFSAADLRAVVAAAGLEPGAVTLRWWFPFRWGLGRLKPAPPRP
ncbi:methyltransferase domain-containing protein [Roseisalinus antarcticus]|uniref:Methyltransferase domain-containing protein n=1 Tax=Roseisalinus antarcticus TaxID=254357 RepID=A0A1Y5TCN4_9RHOB|nr:methyltransferase domain-containing protein [Roseisalinus antarcticus]SLN60952.1 hypothetical protein ROA7023_02826 [Roseisalinus antarcticus]